MRTFLINGGVFGGDKPAIKACTIISKEQA
jgi:hypothetical protein